MLSDYLTTVPGAPRKADAVPGMAHFSGTGPDNTTCRTCVFHRYLRGDRPKIFGGCRKFFLLTQKHGPAVAGNNRSCRHYEARGDQ